MVGYLLGELKEGPLIHVNGEINVDSGTHLQEGKVTNYATSRLLAAKLSKEDMRDAHQEVQGSFPPVSKAIAEARQRWGREEELIRAASPEPAAGIEGKEGGPSGPLSDCRDEAEARGSPKDRVGTWRISTPWAKQEFQSRIPQRLMEQAIRADNGLAPGGGEIGITPRRDEVEGYRDLGWNIHRESPPDGGATDSDHRTGSTG